MPEVATTATAVYTVTPTVQIDQQSFAKINELLLAMEMTEQVGGLSALELRFSNVASEPDGMADFAFEDNQILKLGAAITVYSGDETGPQEIFRGHITGLEADFGEVSPPELVVLAEDTAQRARMERRSQVYPDTSIADIATAIAERLGLTPS